MGDEWEDDGVPLGNQPSASGVTAVVCMWCCFIYRFCFASAFWTRFYTVMPIIVIIFICILAFSQLFFSL